MLVVCLSGFLPAQSVSYTRVGMPDVHLPSAVLRKAFVVALTYTDLVTSFLLSTSYPILLCFLITNTHHPFILTFCYATNRFSSKYLGDNYQVQNFSLVIFCY